MKAVVFDMDGVLVDTEGFYRDRMIQVFEHYHIPYTIEKCNELAGGSQKHDDAFLAKMLDGIMDPKEFHERYEATFRDNPVDYEKILYPGIRECIHDLKAEGYRVALASSSKLVNILEVLEAVNLQSEFEFLLSGEMFHESKPNPEIYLKAADMLGLQPQECLAIEDSTYGLRSATDAGFHVLAKRDDRFGYDQDIAERKFDDFQEILTYLRSKREA